jgi:hypothetical protein
MIEDEVEHDWLADMAEEAGFIISGDGEILVDYNDNLEELLENFANIVANTAIHQYVLKMTADIRGNETLH